MSAKKTGFMLAPGEKNVISESFSPSLATFYMKGELMCSSTRFVYKLPNTLLGIIPLGASENTIPLRSVSAVNTDQKFLVGRFIIGLIFSIVGFSMLGSNLLAAVLLLAIGILDILNSYPSQLNLVNHAGGTNSVTVSVLEGGKLKKFAQEIQARVFADLDQTRHDEAQALRMSQAQLQQMQLQQMQQATLNQQGQYAAQPTTQTSSSTSVPAEPPYQN